jgi:SAM-dependent methyltransferase
MDHRDVTREAFARQAGEFERPDSFFGDRDILAWISAHVPVGEADAVLDVAGGAGHVGRHLAASARFAVVVDLTRELLATGAAAGVRNAVFVEGDATALPFADSQFDVTVCRFAFHHMDEPARAAAEMLRVTRPGGTVAVIDMVDGGGRHNELERLRDPSHTRALSTGELLAMLAGARIVAERDQRMPAEPWLTRAAGPDAPREEILAALASEADGGPATGLRAGRDSHGLFVTHHWVIAATTRASSQG